MKQAGGADAQGPGLFPQPSRQVRGDGQPGFLNPATVAQDVEQTERRRRFVDIRQHAAEKGFVLFPADSETRLRDEVTERQRRRQLIRLSLQMRPRLFHQQCKRGVVGHQMMHQQQQQPTVVGFVIGCINPHQRRLAHIEAVMSRMVTFRQLSGRIARFRVQDDLLYAQRSLAPHDLHGLRQSLPGHGSAQDIVPVNHRLQCNHDLL